MKTQRNKTIRIFFNFQSSRFWRKYWFGRTFASLLPTKGAGEESFSALREEQEIDGWSESDAGVGWVGCNTAFPTPGPTPGREGGRKTDTQTAEELWAPLF